MVNKTAIAFYAMANRNQSLYCALYKYCMDKEKLEGDDYKPYGDRTDYLEKVFINLIKTVDFYSVIMYPELKNRREFIHEVWTIAKAAEKDELKVAVSLDPYFYLTR